MLILFYFLFWTFVLYWLHRLIHQIPVIKNIHLSHHRFINNNSVKWHWNNFFLFNDNKEGTVDLWITEVIPTLLFCFTFQCWYIFIFYYFWAALLQERIEHNPKFNIPILTSGRWHLIHHRLPFNYGLFFPIWDILFNTYKKV